MMYHILTVNSTSKEARRLGAGKKSDHLVPD